MNNDDTIKECIDSIEAILHRRCSDLRLYLFTNDDYDSDTIEKYANDIKISAELLISFSNKLKLK